MYIVNVAFLFKRLITLNHVLKQETNYKCFVNCSVIFRLDYWAFCYNILSLIVDYIFETDAFAPLMKPQLDISKKIKIRQLDN